MGETMSKMVLHSVQTAERTIREPAVLILSVRETEAFVSAVLNPAKPGPVLGRAAKHFKNSLAGCGEAPITPAES